MLTWVQMIIILCFHLNRFAFLCFKITAALLCDVIVSLEVRQVQLNNKDLHQIACAAQSKCSEAM